VAFSGIGAAKAGGALDKYNEASLSAREIAHIWNAATGGGGSDDVTLGDALETSPNAYEEIRNAVRRSRPRDFSIQRLLDRLEQFDIESRSIIPRAFDALHGEDLRTFGELVDLSQANAERLLGNQTAETIALARLARELGADAASAFGAGFGGSVWAMVPANSAALFTRTWRDGYEKEFPGAAQYAIFFTTNPHDGASEIAMENPTR
jgi:galactokinase